MELLVDMMAFWLRVSSLMSSQSVNVAYVMATGAIVDTLAVLMLASMVLTLEYTALTLLPAAHFVLSFSRALSLVVYILCPEWFTSARVLTMLYGSAIASASLFLSCMSATLLSGSASSRQDAQDYLLLNMRLAILTLYSLLNAMISISLVFNRLEERSREQLWHDNETIPTDLLTLNDVTLRTLVLDDAADTIKHDVDSRYCEACCICLCAMVPGDMVSDLMCHHRFHTSCLEGWEASQRSQGRSMLCPMRCDMHSVVKLDGGRFHEA
eukprot:TRINITY_DN11447_c0_g4_i1.p1 TRINITY_DN11447_c0_g4~~TRINITY_DN11447_c0_g4_i1.p1  ORF type:complete len:297 (+),score=27.46 TRINITY_DN11447_c0_g4_i1:85-891(+)